MGAPLQFHPPILLLGGLELNLGRSHIHYMKKKPAAGLTVAVVAGAAAMHPIADKVIWYPASHPLDMAMIGNYATTTSTSGGIVGPLSGTVGGQGNLAEPNYQVELGSPNLKNGGQYQLPKTKV